MRKLILLICLSFSFLLGGCGKKENTSSTQPVSISVIDNIYETQEYLDYISYCCSFIVINEIEDSTVIAAETHHLKESICITYVYYRIDFDNDIHQIKFISAVDADDELIVRYVVDQKGKSK